MSKQNGHHPYNQSSIEISDSDSEQFEYNPDFQRHIGKRTGNYFGRIYPKQNFDGFPRFSQYQSHRNTETSSLAKELESRNSISEAQPNKSREDEKQSQPFKVKESPILIPVDQNNSNSSRMPEIALPGFGQQEISSIKRRTSLIRPSQIKSYKDLLNQLQADQFKQFIFNEEQIEYLTNSAQKEKEQQQQRKKLQINKPIRKKKEARVSFNEKELEKQYCYSFKKNKNLEQESQESLKAKKEQQDSSRFKTEFQGQENQVKTQINVIDFNTATSYPDNFSNDRQPQTQNELKKQEQKKKQKKSNRKKKQLRITDEPEQQYKQKQQQKIDKKKTTKTKTKSKGKNSKEIEEKEKQKQIQNIKQKVTKKSKLKQQPQIKKMSSREVNRLTKEKTKNQIIERLGSDENQLQNNRYPKRTRIKPVQYWDNEKVHYKAGRAIGIQNAHLNFKDLINTNDYYQSHINVNFHTNDIDIDVILPGKKDLISNGIKDPYEILQIELRKDQNSLKDDKEYEIYFDDNLKSEKMLPESITIVNSCTYFQISNRTLFPIVLMMRLKVKVAKNKKQ